MAAYPPLRAEASQEAHPPPCCKEDDAVRVWRSGRRESRSEEADDVGNVWVWQERLPAVPSGRHHVSEVQMRNVRSRRSRPCHYPVAGARAASSDRVRRTCSLRCASMACAHDGTRDRAFVVAACLCGGKIPVGGDYRHYGTESRGWLARGWVHANVMGGCSLVSACMVRALPLQSQSSRFNFFSLAASSRSCFLFKSRLAL